MKKPIIAVLPSISLLAKPEKADAGLVGVFLVIFEACFVIGYGVVETAKAIYGDSIMALKINLIKRWCLVNCNILKLNFNYVFRRSTVKNFLLFALLTFSTNISAGNYIERYGTGSNPAESAKLDSMLRTFVKIAEPRDFNGRTASNLEKIIGKNNIGRDMLGVSIGYSLNFIINNLQDKEVLVLDYMLFSDMSVTTKTHRYGGINTKECSVAPELKDSRDMCKSLIFIMDFSNPIGRNEKIGVTNLLYQTLYSINYVPAQEWTPKKKKILHFILDKNIDGIKALIYDYDMAAKVRNNMSEYMSNEFLGAFTKIID